MALPSIGQTGRYKLKAPFVAKEDVSYKCTGVISIESAEKNGLNVLTTIFVANGLTADDYKAAKDANESLVTIEDGFADIITAPESYVESIPNSDGVTYADNVITLELGQLPADLDLSTLVEDLEQRAKGFTGVDCTGVVHKFTLKTYVSKDEHKAFESAREANKSYDKPDCGKLEDSEQTIADLKKRINALEQIILTNVV